MKHVNFYETIEEARMRLQRSVVLYDGLPYYVLAIVNNSDGIFRGYLLPVSDDGASLLSTPDLDRITNMNYHSSEFIQCMDDYILNNPRTVLRKMMNSPKFGGFKPFPLGMCGTYEARYLERSPRRKSLQGLTRDMVNETFLNTTRDRRIDRFKLLSNEFRDCILGVYQNPTMAFQKTVNDGSCQAFSRTFAFVRGPVGLVLLAYKTDTIGYLPNGLDTVKLSSDFSYTAEAVSELDIFNKIII